MRLCLPFVLSAAERRDEATYPKKTLFRATWNALDKRRIMIYAATFLPDSRWNDFSATIGSPAGFTERLLEYVVPFRVSTMKQSIWATALLVALTMSAGATHLPQTEPDPLLSPLDVVRIQIEALWSNDTPYENRGIEVTYNFASPANKRMTGPLERFKAMVRNPIYGPMINHHSAKYENFKLEGDFAQIDVILSSKEGEYLGYRFILSRQHGNQYEGSWMTDAVMRFDVLTL